MTARPKFHLPLFLAVLAACGSQPPARGGDSVAVRPRAARQPAPAAASAPAQPARDHLLLVVDWNEEGSAFAEAIAVLPAGGGYRAVPFADSLDAFYARWLEPGHSYTVLSAGRPAGTAVVGTNDSQGCAAAGAEVDTRGAGPPDWGSALATDLPVGAGAPTRRPAERADSAAMAELLRRAVAAHGGGWEDGADVRVRAIVMPGGTPVLAGSVEVGGDQESGDPPSAAAFVIAERAGGEYRPVVVWTPASAPAGEEERPRSRLLLDAADLDGDGVPELVTRTGFSEWSQYTIYRRGPQGWTVAWEGSGGGC